MTLSQVKTKSKDGKWKDKLTFGLLVQSTVTKFKKAYEKSKSRFISIFRRRYQVKRKQRRYNETRQS
jgi:hypothetical protein